MHEACIGCTPQINFCHLFGSLDVNIFFFWGGGVSCERSPCNFNGFACVFVQV